FNLWATELGQLTPVQLMTMQQQEKPLVIDVRTVKEWQQTGIIPNSYPLQSFDENGHFDEDKWIDELKKSQENSDQPIVLVCRSGNRSGKIGKLLTEKLGMENIYHLSNGIKQWMTSGHKTVENCSPNQTC
ncbi:MAG: rhodanese-like domain-containing protein, partial [Methylococcaceae bacterium]|nr:rhodanese-like domain-containing protein [Methylococcaceae bacterium]